MKYKVQNEFGDSCVRHCYKIAIHSTLNVRRCDTYFSLKIKYKPGSSYKFFLTAGWATQKFELFPVDILFLSIETIIKLQSYFMERTTCEVETQGHL